MTQIKVDNIADAAGTGAPDFEDGLTVAGSAISTLNTAEYYESGTEPTSPKNGAIWWDTTNEKVMVYIAGEFKEVELGASGASGWIADVANFSNATSETFSVASQETTPRDVVFNADGTKMYIVGQSADSILQYSLSTAFDVSTASYDSVSYDPLGSNQYALRFNSDGTKFYNLSSPTLYQYSMSTAYDISTASYDNVTFDFTSTSSSPYAFDISPDGTKLVAVSFIDDVVTQYTMSTAFDLSTLSYDSISLDISSNAPSCFGVSWSADGGALYVNDVIVGEIVQYLCSTAFDISTATYDDAYGYSIVGGQGLTFNADGSKLYITSSGTDSVHTLLTGL